MKKVEAIKTISATDAKPGMVIRVHQKIKETNAKGEEKERIQIYEGLVIKHRGGKESGSTLTVRKISEGVGVEKIFPTDLPSIDKIELVTEYDVRRSKLYFVRDNPKKMKEMSMGNIVKKEEKTTSSAKAAEGKPAKEKATA